MNYMGIDISMKSTGLAVMDQHENIIKTGTIKNPSGQATGQHYARIRDHIHYVLTTCDVEVVIVEDLFIMYNNVAKMIHPIHGVIKEIVHRTLNQEVILYPQQTWRAKLGIKKLTKKEREVLIPVAQAEKGKRYITYHKHLCDIKHRVVAYVNKRLETNYTFADNDITDALGLILAHKDTL